MENDRIIPAPRRAAAGRVTRASVPDGVVCPICGRTISLSRIQVHADRCAHQHEPNEPLARRIKTKANAASASGPPDASEQQASSDHQASSSAASVPDRISIFLEVRPKSESLPRRRLGIQGSAACKALPPTFIRRTPPEIPSIPRRICRRASRPLWARASSVARSSHCLCCPCTRSHCLKLLNLIIMSSCTLRPRPREQRVPQRLEPIIARCDSSIMALPETSIFLADEHGHLCRARNAQRLKQLREEERTLGEFERRHAHHGKATTAKPAATRKSGAAACTTGDDSVAGHETRAKLRKRSYASTCRTESTEDASLMDARQAGQSSRSRRTSISQRGAAAAAKLRPGPRGDSSEQQPLDEQQSTDEDSKKRSQPTADHALKYLDSMAGFGVPPETSQKFLDILRVSCWQRIQPAFALELSHAFVARSLCHSRSKRNRSLPIS